MTEPVTPDRVRDILAAYGAAPQRWPAAERDAILALVATDASLAQALAEARALDGLLDDAPAPPAMMVNPIAIAAAARSGGRSTAAAPAVAAGPRLRWRIAGMAAAAVLGFVVGVSGLAPPRSTVDRDDIAAAFAGMIEEDVL